MKEISNPELLRGNRQVRHYLQFACPECDNTNLSELPLSIKGLEQGAGSRYYGAFLVVHPVFGAQEHEDFAVCRLHVTAVAGTGAEQDGSFLP